MIRIKKESWGGGGGLVDFYPTEASSRDSTSKREALGTAFHHIRQFQLDLHEPIMP
jgi:hypothetical protein